MMDLSDEKLIIAAVKGDCQAEEELKSRIKTTIRDAIKRGARSYKGDTDILEDHILNKVINSIDSYMFIGPFRRWIKTLTINKIIAEIRATSAIDPDAEKSQANKSLSERQRNLGNVTESKKHPPMENIDSEIRSLVGLLNQSSHIRTTSSCSGHPDREVWDKRSGHPWNQYGGWIHIVPTKDPRRAFDFILGLLTRLDNTHHRIGTKEDTLDTATRERYQQVDADSLFCSNIPMVIVDINLRFFACHPKAEECIFIWKKFMNILNESLLIDEEFSKDDRTRNLNMKKINTPEEAAKYLQQILLQLPFILSVKFDTNPSGYSGIRLHTKADLALLQRFSALAYRIHQFENTTNQQIDSNGEIPISTKWFFSLQPFLNQELIPLSHLMKPKWQPRTKEDHLKIWKLLEIAVEEMLD